MAALLLSIPVLKGMLDIVTIVSTCWGGLESESMQHQLNDMTSSYSISLVILSLVIAVMASYTSLDLALKVTTSNGRSRKAWLISGAIAMGTGIWSMHFVAMLALHLPHQSVSYDLLTIAVSILIAIAASFVGLFFASAPEREINKLILGGLFLGIGICEMHYVGMEAMKGVEIHYHPVFFSLSYLIAIGASILALVLVFYLRDHHSPDRPSRKFGSSLVMGLAIFGMHFTGMKATVFTPIQQNVTSTHLFIMDQSALALIIAIFTLIMLSLVHIGSYIDQKFKTQLEMQREEKLRVLGDLTSAFAHEIRNPMQVNRGFLQLLNERPLSEDLKNYINICIEEMDRANGIISDYLSFAKPEAEHIESFDVADQILRVINILSSYAMMNQVELRSHLEPCRIRGNVQKFNQSLINILKNGVEAMPSGGTLRVCCRTENQEVVIDIIDEGVGMTKEQMDQLGTPFYSLKEKGTGLGLMVSYRIIQSFYGKIQVASEKGKGTTFTIIFPQCASSGQANKRMG